MYNTFLKLLFCPLNVLFCEVHVGAHVTVTVALHPTDMQKNKHDTCKPRRYAIALFSTDKYLNSGSFSRTPVSRVVRLLPAKLSHVNFDCLLKPEIENNTYKNMNKLTNFRYVSAEWFSVTVLKFKAELSHLEAHLFGFTKAVLLK